MITDRIDAITKIEDTSPVAKIPKSVKIELTGMCNFKCVFCARSDRLREQKEMDRGFFERITKEMRDEGVVELGLFYLGESFMCNWLEEAIYYAAKVLSYPYVFLTTNGSLSTPERVAKCIENGLDSLKFSFNYCDEKQFEEISRMPGRLYGRMIDNIKAAKEVRDNASRHCGLYASYIQYDGEQGERMKEAIEEIRPYVDEIYALPLYSQADLVGEEESKRGWAVTAGNRGRMGALRDPIPCWAAFTEGHITWDGKLNACCFGHTEDLEMGDLKKQPFSIAWNSDKFVGLRKAHAARNIVGTPCEACVAYQ